MNILVALTYYRPHVSGLTIYVERLSRALARRGHRVTVMTSRYDKALPPEEVMEGVRVVRAPVLGRISKGVLMPTLGILATKMVLENDVLSLHLPQLDASGIATRAKLLGRPTVLTYHSDLILPPSLINWMANRVVDASNNLAAILSDAISAYTDDFAQHSPYLSKYLPKVRVIPPPVELPVPNPADVEVFRRRHHLHDKTVIGIAVRLAAEKGVEVLLAALPIIAQKYPNIHIVHAGPREAIGESLYFRKIMPLLKQHESRYTHVGTLNPQEMATFFGACHVSVLPSLNNTETFGLVQIESMLCGTPSVASALPGVRQPTAITGMGRTAPIGDANGLAEAIIDVLDNRPRYVRPREAIAARFAPDSVAGQYELLFEELMRRKRRR